MTQSPRSLLLLLLLCFVAGCQAPPAEDAPASHVLTKLYFGLSKPKGQITSQEWSAFVDQEISPRFPAGFTLYSAQGAWLDSETQTTQREPSRVLEVLHKGDFGAPSRDPFEDLIRHYKKQFQQESVLRLEYPVNARF